MLTWRSKRQQGLYHQLAHFIFAIHLPPKRGHLRDRFTLDSGEGSKFGGARLFLKEDLRPHIDMRLGDWDPKGRILTADDVDYATRMRKHPFRPDDPPTGNWANFCVVVISTYQGSHPSCEFYKSLLNNQVLT